jgi:hypothetical protein
LVGFSGMKEFENENNRLRQAVMSAVENGSLTTRSVTPTVTKIMETLMEGGP